MESSAEQQIEIDDLSKKQSSARITVQRHSHFNPGAEKLGIHL